MHRPTGQRWLSQSTEGGELNRFQGAVAAREEAIARTVEVIQKAWYAAAGEHQNWHPADHLVRQFINKYGAEIAYQTLVDVAPKVYEGYIKKSWVPYAWAVARNLAARQDEEVEVFEGETPQILHIPDGNEATSSG